MLKQLTTAAILLFMMLPGLARQVAAKSVTEAMADGALAASSVKLRRNRDSEAGRDLLKFALFVDPDNQQALLLQAKLERELPFDTLSYSQSQKEYIAFLKKVIAATRSEERKLLLFKVIDLVNPHDDATMLALTKAKNAGIDTDFDALLAAVKQENQPSDNGGEKKPSTDKDADHHKNNSHTANPKNAENNLGDAVAAEDLYKKLTSHRIEDIKKYREKVVKVKGVVDKAGTTFGKPYIELAEGRVHVILGDAVTKREFGDLEAQFESIDERARQYEEWGYTPSYRYEIHFSCVGKCTGLRAGHVVIEDCKDVSWDRKYIYTP